MFRRLFSLEGKNRHLFVACDLRTESSERTGDEMVVTVEELKRLEEADIRDLRREDLDNAGDIEIDRSKPANQRMREFLEKDKKSVCGECRGIHPDGHFFQNIGGNAGGQDDSAGEADDEDPALRFWRMFYLFITWYIVLVRLNQS